MTHGPATLNKPITTRILHAIISSRSLWLRSGWATVSIWLVGLALLILLVVNLTYNWKCISRIKATLEPKHPKFNRFHTKRRASTQLTFPQVPRRRTSVAAGPKFLVNKTFPKLQQISTNLADQKFQQKLLTLNGTNWCYYAIVVTITMFNPCKYSFGLLTITLDPSLTHMHSPHRLFDCICINKTSISPIKER
jgi:hypothetical protein